MTQHKTDAVFTGSIPEMYDSLMVPLLFEPYAADLARRLASRTVESVLEVAAGTGVVTRAIASTLPDTVTIVATDLNLPMIEYASGLGTRRPVEWRQADAMQLPFPDDYFDAVVCQFGVMFFPEKARAFSEVRRVLRRGGMLLFSVWDRIEENEFADTVTASLQGVFPDDPPLFLRRTPHGYFDTSLIGADLAGAGFTRTPQVATVAARSRAASPRLAAVAFCHGTPLRNEIVARDESRLDEATEIAAEAIARRFGRGAVDGKMQAHVVSVEK